LRTAGSDIRRAQIFLMRPEITDVVNALARYLRNGFSK
jgi:hypothetical protein